MQDRLDRGQGTDKGQEDQRNSLSGNDRLETGQDGVKMEPQWSPDGGSGTSQRVLLVNTGSSQALVLWNPGVAAWMTLHCRHGVTC